MFTCDEGVYLTDRRWQQLCSITFTLFSTGAQIEDRPDYTLSESVLTLTFTSSSHFQNYVRRAFFTEGTRLISFEVLEKSPKFVICKAIFNLTPKIRILGEPLEPDDDLEAPNTVILHAWIFALVWPWPTRSRGRTFTVHLSMWSWVLTCHHWSVQFCDYCQGFREKLLYFRARSLLNELRVRPELFHAVRRISRWCHNRRWFKWLLRMESPRSPQQRFRLLW